VRGKHLTLGLLGSNWFGLRLAPWTAGHVSLACKAISPYIRSSHEKTNVMPTLTITAKGQVTLRKDLLQHLGVHPGEKVSVVRLPDGRIEIKAARPEGQISDVFNFLKRETGPSLSIEEINRIAAEGWAGKQ
jgi:AbrB family looped-hinge helix DNA binding protein